MNKVIRSYPKKPIPKIHKEKLEKANTKMIPYYKTTGLKITDLTSELG